MNQFVVVVLLHVHRQLQMLALVLWMAGKVENNTTPAIILYRLFRYNSSKTAIFLTFISDRLLNTGLTFIEALKQNDDGRNARGYWDNGAFIGA